jgi:hypothetical protein
MPACCAISGSPLFDVPCCANIVDSMKTAALAQWLVYLSYCLQHACYISYDIVAHVNSECATAFGLPTRLFH